MEQPRYARPTLVSATKAVEMADVYLVSSQDIAAEDTPCRVALRRAEDARQESRILGYVLIGLVAVVALALCMVVGLAVAGESTAGTAA